MQIFYHDSFQPDLSTQILKGFWVKFQFNKLENSIGYKFKDRAYLLQAFTHASYYRNRITGCYQVRYFLIDKIVL